MSAQSVHTIFESFNARALEPAQVAKTFVPSRNFDDLLKRRHTLIVGPRGSGKTTLLKMLQQPALRAWNHPSAEEYRSQVTFTGVFVPTDISWSVQVASLGEGTLDEQTRRLLSVATFTTHTLRSLVIALENRTFRNAHKVGVLGEVVMDDEVEALLASKIATSWQMSGTIRSLVALRWALGDRLREIFSVASKEILLGENGRSWRLAAIPYLHLHFLAASGRAIELFEDLAQIQIGKWAFLFDELELAPKWIQRELGSSLRSTDSRFLFKLALNPFTENDSLLRTAVEDERGSFRPAPSADQDFDQIALWYVSKAKAFEFCTELWYEMLHQRQLPQKTPEKVFGESYFGTSPGNWRQVYRKGSRVAQRFSELALKDPTFARYLNRKNVNPDLLDELTDIKRAATVRKIAPVVAVREFYRRQEVLNTPTGALRSRKTAVLYSGAESLFALTEGNPRWFIGIVERLLDDLQASKEKKIQPSWQSEQARGAAERFQAMLSTIPVPKPGTGKRPIGVLACVEQIATFLHEKVVRGPFQSDPPGTFIVDGAVPDAILGSLGRAINAGAIVYVPDAGPLVIQSLPEIRGKRFRVSYLLAPIYGLPLRLGKAIALSSILTSVDKPTAAAALPSKAVDQLSLLSDTEE
jgi:energy-coupling factor transporter ATP-binding protein EcfA2